MKITLKNIVFHGFKSKSKTASVSFFDDVSIIYAENGLGKTSFLNALYYFLTQQEAELVNLNINKITCSYEENGKDKITTVSYDTKKFSFDWKDYEKSSLARSSSTYIAIERAVNHKSFSDLTPNDILDYMTSSNYLTQYSTPAKRTIANDMYAFLLKKREKIDKEKGLFESTKTYRHEYIKNNNIYNLETIIKEEYKKYIMKSSIVFNKILFESLNDLFSNKKTNRISEEIILDILKNKDQIIELVQSIYNIDEQKDLDVRFDIIELLKNPEESISIALKESLITPMIYNLSLKIDEIKALSNINVLISTFNSYLDESKELIVKKDSVYIEIDSKNSKDNHHDLNSLSSGERHILTLLTTILLKSQDKDFLLIDEPEISLNVKWQINLIDSLRKLVPNTQIIVASHSPYIPAKKYSNNLCELSLK